MERGLTQPAISRQVSALEEHFGTRLVQRSTHAVTLTEEGRQLVPAAQQLVDSADALMETTGRRRGKAVGCVRLSVPAPLGLYFSKRLGALLENTPSYQLISSSTTVRAISSERKSIFRFVSARSTIPR